MRIIKQQNADSTLLLVTKGMIVSNKEYARRIIICLKMWVVGRHFKKLVEQWHLHAKAVSLSLFDEIYPCTQCINNCRTTSYDMYSENQLAGCGHGTMFMISIVTACIESHQLLADPLKTRSNPYSKIQLSHCWRVARHTKTNNICFRYVQTEGLP